MKKVFLSVMVALLCACSKEQVEKAEGVTFFIYPAVEGKAGNIKCENFLGRCMLFQTDKPLFQLSGFRFKASSKTDGAANNQIELFLDARQAADFEAVPEKYVGEGKRLALVYRGRIIHAPKLKARIKSSALIIDFCNANVYEIVLASLRGKYPPDYKFSDDDAWNTCELPPEK